MSPETQQIINLLSEIRDLLKARPAATPPTQRTFDGTTNDKNTYTKLRDGSWGVRCVSAVKPGDSVTVTTKDNKKRTETVNELVFKGEDRRTGRLIWICSIVPRGKGSADSQPADAPAAAAQAEAEANAAAAQEEDDVPF